jgi:N-acetylmuramoyl-L-alanine amidase
MQDRGFTRLGNVRNFTGRDFARVVIDLSNQTDYSQRREGANRLVIHLDDAFIPALLHGRRFLISDSALLKGITVIEGAGVDVVLDVGAIGDYSVYQIGNPERLVIDLHSTFSRSSSSMPAPTVATRERRSSPSFGGNAILNLPELTEPITTRSADSPIDTGVHSDSPSGIRCIVIDPGHGGHDNGTVAPGGLKEKDLVLDVARRLRAYIKSEFPEVEVILTRESDRFVALEERTAIANSRRADLFISIHANASTSRIAAGVETFFVSPDRAKTTSVPAEAAQSNAEATSKKEPDGSAPATESPARSPEPVVASVSVGNRIAASRDLARYIQSGLVRGIGAASPRTAVNRGVKHAPFAVLIGSTMPSVLAEVSFMSNARDEGLLRKSEFRERIAASLFAGLKGYLKRNKQTDSAKKK